MSSLIILSITSFTAVAADPATPHFEAARTEYRAALTDLLATAMDVEQIAVSQCGEAKQAYRSAEAELSRITKQLEHPASEVLGEVIVNYTTTLQNLKQKEVKKRQEAMILAKATGTEFVAARMKIEAIQAEIARIEAEERREEVASHPSDGLGGPIRARGQIDSGGLGYDYAPQPHPHPLLPSEFRLCFPEDTADFADAK